MRLGRITLAGLAMIFLLGCATGLEFFNDDLLAELGLRPRASRLPGEAPVVVVGMRNDTARVAEFRLSWRDGESEVFQRTSGLIQPGALLQFAEFCPVEEVTLGDVANLSTIGSVIRLGAGTAADPTIEVEPFGILLQRGIHYECGDRVIFSVRNSSATLSGYRLFAEIEKSGLQTSEDDDDESNGG